MSITKIPLSQRARVAEAANYECGYCRTQEIIIGMPLDIDHIVPEAKGGSSDDENLWLACRRCNEFKGVQTSAVDPKTREQVPLFNPRTQRWSKHFAWAEKGALIVGLTPSGRATVEALRLNNDHIVPSRRRWASVGWHPPQG